ncbi:hypothetical protein J2780_003881 [Chryseobacterium camelliae]|nr:hypothetical protein [Chryseobacterium camelliae]
MKLYAWMKIKENSFFSYKKIKFETADSEKLIE